MASQVAASYNMAIYVSASYNMGIYVAKQLDNGELEAKMSLSAAIGTPHKNTSTETKTQLACIQAKLNRQNPASYNMGIYVAN